MSLQHHILEVCTRHHQMPLAVQARQLWITCQGYAVNPRAEPWTPFLLLSRENFVAAAQTLRRERQLDPSSLATGLAGTLAVAALVGISCPWVKFFLVQLKREKNRMGPTWMPDDEGQVVTAAQATRLHLYWQTDKVACAAWIAWVNGRRISDVLRLERVYVLQRNQIGGAVLLRLHKTAGTKGSISMHCPPIVMDKILWWMDRTTDAFIFLDNTTSDPESVKRAMAQATRHLKRIHLPTTDLRGLRRAGLSNASAIAEREEDLLVLSDHSNLNAMRTYLGRGLLSVPRRQTQVNFVNHLANMTSVHERTTAPHLITSTASSPALTEQRIYQLAHQLKTNGTLRRM